jgi:hypothetical protein
VRRLVLPLVAGCVIVVAAVVVAVVVWPDAESESVDDALAVLPADAEVVTFVDAAAARERLGHGDLTSESSEGEVEAFFRESMEDAPWGGSSLSTYFASMEDWGWSWADVEWEAEYVGADAYATAFKLRDDLDMDAVLDSFADQGYESSDVDGYPAYSLDVQDASGDAAPVVPLLEVVAMPDEHLLLTGPDAEALLAAATDDADTLAETDVAPELVDAIDDPEYFVLAVGESSCVPGGSGSAGQTPSEQVPGADDLNAITGYVAAATAGDGELAAQAVSAYADEAAAAEDVGPRTALLEEGTSPISDQPYSELFDADVESAGGTLRYDLGGDETARRLPQLTQSFVAPWAFCPS